MTDSADYVASNRAYWDEQASAYASDGARAWSEEPHWGILHVPETALQLLPEKLEGLDCIELGCGTAYVSSWLARRGARAVGIDNSPEQLATARRLQNEYGCEFPLHLGNAEATPFADASFDFAISEYGAAIWCDPDKWIAEAARLLRPGGQLVFLGNSTLMMLAMPKGAGTATDRLRRPQRDMRRFESNGDGSVEFHVSPGEWIRILRRNGFEVEDLIEIYPAQHANVGFPWVSAEWASQWPCEEVWQARKRA